MEGGAGGSRRGRGSDELANIDDRGLNGNLKLVGAGN